MSIRKTLLGLLPAAFLGLAPAAADAAVVYCTSAGYPAGCVVRVAPRVIVAPAPVVVAPRVVAPRYVAPRYAAPRSAINRGGPVNRVGVR
jgi:hypothetical protein